MSDYDIICLFFFTFGLCMVFSTVNVFMRDMTYIVPFAVRLWFFLTPVFYECETRIPPGLMDFYMIANPMAMIISVVRTGLMGLPLPSPLHMGAGVLVCFAVFWLGYLFFKRYEDMMVKRI